MPDKSKLEDRSIKDPSPQQLREELEKHVRHMLDHDPKRLEFALLRNLTTIVLEANWTGHRHPLVRDTL